MNTHTLIELLRTPQPWGRLQILRDLMPWMRLHFLYAALECGLLVELKDPCSKETLAERIDAQRGDLLDALLELGVSVGELSRDGDIYGLRGSRARALIAEGGQPMAALLREYLTMHHSAYEHLARRLAGGPKGNYVEGTGNLIATSSRIAEPLIKGFLKEVVPSDVPLRVLEIGCGSGIYLRHLAENNPHIFGTALDMQEEVAQQATANLDEWGLRDRFDVLQADIRELPNDVGGPFDLATLHNNIYYFPVDERPALFRTIHRRMVSGGTLLIVSMMSGNGHSATASDFDLLLRSSEDCWPLPDVDALVEQLRSSGFGDVTTKKLIFWEPLYGIVATKTYNHSSAPYQATSPSTQT